MGKFTRTYTMRLFDFGGDYAPKYTSVLTYFQECFAELCKKHRMTGVDLREKGLMWIISNINIEYLDTLPRWNEDLRIEIWFSEIKKLRAFLEFRAYKGSAVVAHGDSCFFVLNMKSRKPVSVNEILKDCEVEPETIFENRKKGRLQINQTNKIGELFFKTNFNDLDYNGHVNNISYVQWGFATMPVEFLKTYKIKKCEIDFHQECFIDEDIQTQLYQDGNNFEFLVSRKSDNSLICKINVATNNTEVKNGQRFKKDKI